MYKSGTKMKGHKKKITICIIDNYLFVELVGFEPTSKQGNHMLSTCLFQPSVFVPRQDLDHQPRPYPLKLHQCTEAYTDYFRFTCTAESLDSEQHPWSDVSFCQPCGGIKLIYCTSIKQRERNCFRQLNF